jgi:hypothetical protein
MARNPVEIQADIAQTRRVIEHQLDALTRRVPHGWWIPCVTGAGAFTVGLLLSRLPMLRLVALGARTVQAGIAVAGTVAAVDRFLAGRRPPTSRAGA